jgi:uncharacterized protein (TIGR02145 family)
LNIAQRNALVNPDSSQDDKNRAVGLMIFNTENQCLEFWSGLQWISRCDGDVPPLRPPTNPNLPPPPTGAICLSGRTCFDVAQSHTDTNFASDFVASATRTFTLGGNATNTRFYIINNVYNAVVALNQNENTVEIVFRDDINSIMNGNEGAFTLIAQFNIGAGTERFQRSLNIRIQDETCCMVRSSLCAGGQGWLTFMCHNLGAENWSIIDQMHHTPNPTNTDQRVWGSIFQWGRYADGHQNRTSLRWPNENDNIQNGVVSGAGNFNLNGQIANTHGAFGRFIKQEAVPVDWRLPQIDTLWNNGTEVAPVKTSNDPCPAGWRIPTFTEWSSILATTGPNGNARGIANVGSRGVYFAPANTDGRATLFLPTAGWRNIGDGVFNSVGITGAYWSSRTVGVLSSSLVFTTQHNLNANSSRSRADGFSIRCIAE